MTTIKAVRLRGRVAPEGELEILDAPPELPAGEVELILLYSQPIRQPVINRPSPVDWPVLHGGRYLGGRLRREDIYADDGR
jgi:hypothetical protein